MTRKEDPYVWAALAATGLVAAVLAVGPGVLFLVGFAAVVALDEWVHS